MFSAAKEAPDTACFVLAAKRVLTCLKATMQTNKIPQSKAPATAQMAATLEVFPAIVPVAPGNRLLSTVNDDSNQCGM
ncbi:hypothetical protein D3C80_1987330 [compost metagenome]